MPQLNELTYLQEYDSMHRLKLESRGWNYLGSQEHVVYIEGRPKARWRHFFTKGRRTCVAGEALKLEGFKA